MSFKKVIMSGHIVEVYEYQFEPSKPKKKQNKDIVLEYLLTGDVERYNAATEHENEVKKLLTKQQNKEHNNRRKRAKFRRLVVSNFTGQANFITLTYKENMTDVKRANADFDIFMKKLRRKFGKEFKFAVVTEFQDRGAVHFHMLADLGITWESENECRRLEVEFAEQYWVDRNGNSHGFVDLKDVKHVDNLGAYMSKYMTKDLSDTRLDGKKAFRTSLNMDRPVVLTGDQADEIIKMYELKQKTEKYTSNYTSEYLGSITYKEYNLKTLENKHKEEKMSV